MTKRELIDRIKARAAVIYGNDLEAYALSLLDEEIDRALAELVRESVKGLVSNALGIDNMLQKLLARATLVDFRNP